MTNSKEMKENIEKTKNYLLSLSKEELLKMIEEADNDIGNLILEAGFLNKEYFEAERERKIILKYIKEKRKTSKCYSFLKDNIHHDKKNKFKEFKIVKRKILTTFQKLKNFFGFNRTKKLEEKWTCTPDITMINWHHEDAEKHIAEFLEEQNKGD